MTAQPTASWRLAARLAGRDLRGGLKGFYIFIACLWLGVGSIAAVQSLSTSMLDSLRHDSRYILGGDLSLRRLYQGASADQRAMMEQAGKTSEVIEMRAMTRRSDDAKATMVELKAVDALYPLYGALDVVDGNEQPIAADLQDLLAPADTPRALAEKELLTHLGIAVGDTVKVGDTSFTIAGIIAREPDRMSGTRYTLAPRLLIRTADFAATGLNAAGNQVTYNYRLYLPDMVDRDALVAIEERFENDLGEGWRGRSYYNAAPGIKRSIDQMTLFLTLIGLATLLIGGVGISNAVRGWLDRKMAALATLKSLGAPRKLVLRVYLLQILAVATVGIALGSVTGTALASIGSKLLSAELALTNQGGFSLLALGVSAAFGYLTVLTFTLWPLGRAIEAAPRDLFRSTITPTHTRPKRDIVALTGVAAVSLAALAVLTATDRSLAGWFVVATLAAFTLFSLYALGIQKLLRRFRPQRMPALRLASANLARPGNATAPIVLSLGLGLTVLAAIALVESNFSRLLRDDLALDAPSFFFLDVEPVQQERFAEILATTPGVEHVKLTPAYRGRIIAVNGIDPEVALVDKREEWVTRSDRGFTYAAEQPPHSRIIEGAWWPAGFNTATAGVAPQISISTDVQRAFDIGVGDELTVNIMGVQLTAMVVNVRDINWASFTMNFAVTFAPGALDNAPTNLLATAVVPAEQEDALQTQLAREMPNITSVRVREALALANKLVGGVLLAVRITAAITLAAGVLVLAGALAAARQRQVYDTVVLKVLGASRRRLLGTFVMEYMLLGLVTAAIAAVLGSFGAYAIIVGIMELPWHFAPMAVVQVTALALLLTLATGIAATARLLALKPARFLRNE